MKSMASKILMDDNKKFLEVVEYHQSENYVLLIQQKGCIFLFKD